MVGSSHDHRINILALHDLAIIPGGENIITINSLCIRQAPVVKIAGGNQFYTRHRNGSISIRLTHATSANHCYLDMIIRANFFYPF